MKGRCAKCGSKNIEIINKNDGLDYDIKKGAVGVALMGTGGAVMGLQSKTETYYKCNDCGEILPYLMNSITAENIDKYLAAPAVYGVMLDIEKKLFPNIEWSNPNVKEKVYKTNDDLADSIYNFMTQSKVYALTEKDICESFGVGRLDFICPSIACIGHDKLKWYADSIDTDLNCAFLIPEIYYKEFADLLFKEQKTVIRESKITDIAHSFVMNKYIGFIQQEKILDKISNEFIKKMTRTNYIMQDSAELYGMITGDFNLIPYSKDYASFLSENRKRARSYFDGRSDGTSDEIYWITKRTLLNLDAPIKYSDFLKKINELLTSMNINMDEKIMNYQIVFSLRAYTQDSKMRVCKIDFSESIEDPIISKLSDEDLKQLLEQEMKEKEERKNATIENRKRLEEERQRLRAEKEKAEAQKHDRRMSDLSFQYFNEIERVLKRNPGLSCSEIYLGSEKLKEISQTNTNELSDLLRYLVKKGKCGSFKLNDSHTVYYYLNDGSVNVDAIKKEKEQPSSSSTTPDKKSSQGCYIATCVYGSYDCPQVWTLRRYRDNTLAKKWYGREFIHIYYTISPTLVKWFGDTDWFQKFWRNKLNRIITRLNDNGIESSPYSD